MSLPSKQSIWYDLKFHYLAIGYFFQSLSQSMYLLALPLFVYERTNSPFLMSAMAIFETVTQIVLSPFIGTIVDRFRRKNVIVIGLILQVTLLLLIPIFDYFSGLNIWIVFILGSLVAALQAAIKNAQFTIVPTLFPDKKLQADAGITTIHTATLMFGGTLSGFIIALINPLYSIITIMFMLSITILVQLRLDIPNDKMRDTKGNKNSFFYDTKEGFTYIFSNRSLILLIVIFSISNLADNGLMPVLLYHLKHNLQLSEGQIGITMSAAGVGLFIGSLIAGRLKKISAGKAIFWFMLINNIGITLFLIPGWWPILIGQFIFHLGGIVANIVKSVVIQTIVPIELLGRVSGTMRIMDQGTQPISLALLGAVAGIHGSYMSFVVMVLLTLVSTIVLFVSSIRKLAIENIES